MYQAGVRVGDFKKTDHSVLEFYEFLEGRFDVEIEFEVLRIHENGASEMSVIRFGPLTQPQKK